MAAGGSLRHELLLPAVSLGGSGNGVAIDVAGEMLHLLPDGAVWWASAQTLWLSDLHLGKAAHFRKHGVPIGSEPTLATLHRLREQIQALRPGRVSSWGPLPQRHQPGVGAVRRHVRGVSGGRMGACSRQP